jgi:hypothetical protein
MQTFDDTEPAALRYTAKTNNHAVVFVEEDTNDSE